MNRSERRSIVLCAVISIGMTLLFLRNLPVLWPLHLAAVRAQTLVATERLREQGLWAVLADPVSIHHDAKGTCVDWNYAYRGKYVFPVRRLTTCSYDTNH